MEKQFIILLKNRYNQMSEAEKKVAEYIINNPEEIVDMSIGTLVQKVGVAASGIVRMCKNLGFSGFSEAKRSLLVQMLTQSAPVIMPKINQTDSVGEVFDKVFLSSIQSLNDTQKMLDISQIEKAVDVLYKAKNIHFFGVGTSATISQDAYYRFMRIGLPAHSEVDSHIMQIAAMQLGEGDVAVAISHCGDTIDTVETLRIAKESGATTMAITSKKDSHICKYADILIVVYSDEIQYPMEAVSARISHIAVLDALCVAISLRNIDVTSDRIDKMQNIFKNKRIK